MEKKLKDYTAQPDPEVWERIENTLHRRALHRKWTRIAAGAAAVAAIVVAIVLINPASTSSDMVPDTPLIAQATIDATTITGNTPSVAGSQQQAISTVAQTPQQRKETIAENRLPQPSSPITQTVTPVNTETPAVSAPVSAIATQPYGQTPVSAPTEPKTNPEAIDASQPTETDIQTQTARVVEPQQPTAKATTSVQNDTILWIPNAFAPASDDESITIFRPRLNRPGEKLTDYRMAIFNRNGMQVFKSTSIDQGWNGTYKGRPLSQGTYVYVIYYTDKDKLRHQRKGTVTLIR